MREGKPSNKLVQINWTFGN